MSNASLLFFCQFGALVTSVSAHLGKRKQITSRRPEKFSLTRGSSGGPEALNFVLMAPSVPAGRRGCEPHGASLRKSTLLSSCHLGGTAEEPWPRLLPSKRAQPQQATPHASWCKLSSSASASRRRCSAGSAGEKSGGLLLLTSCSTLLSRSGPELQRRSCDSGAALGPRASCGALQRRRQSAAYGAPESF